MKINKAGNF